MSQAASAQNCLQDDYGKNVQCTANDVRIAFATSPRGLDGTPLLSCSAGSTFSFVADFHVTTTATARENIGMYFATGGQGSALKGACADNIIAPLHKSANLNDTVWLGTSQYEELDLSTPTDTCGDISTSDNNQVITVEVPNVKCQAAAGTNQLALPNCTSWQQPGGTLLCVSPAPNYPWVPAAIPGSPSKCNCDSTFTVPIVVQTPSITVAKSCDTTLTTGSGNTTCDAGQEGGSVTYNLAISNASNFGGIAIDQICDSAYGNVFTVSGFPACPAGTNGTVTSTTCSALSIAASAIGTCSFTATQGENAAVKNIVSISGHGTSGGTPFGPIVSNQVTVTSTDAPSTATVTKSFNSNLQICATLRYNVDVKNTSGADENLTLNSLTDSAFGNIIPNTSSSVIGTTCAVPQSLPVGGADYTCTFDAQFCGAPTTIVTTQGKCTSGTCTVGKTGTCSADSDCNLTCTGIQHLNQVSASLTGDEVGDTVTMTPGSLTASECFTVSTQ